MNNDDSEYITIVTNKHIILYLITNTNHLIQISKYSTKSVPFIKDIYKFEKLKQKYAFV